MHALIVTLIDGHTSLSLRSWCVIKTQVWVVGSFFFLFSLSHREMGRRAADRAVGLTASGRTVTDAVKEILVVRLLQHGGIVFQVRGNSAREASATENVYTCYRTEEAAAAAQRVRLPARQ